MGSSGLQVNLGTFGTRKLEEFLNPMLLAFVDRLNLGRSMAFNCLLSSLSLYSMAPMVEKEMGHGLMAL